METETNKVIEILQAYNEGKRVEYLFNDRWYGACNLNTVLDYLSRDISLVRIAPEKQYRPYANANEFLKASKEHGPYINRRQYAVFSQPVVVDSGGVLFDFSKDYSTYEELLKDGYWQDGSRIGIQVYKIG